MPDEELQFGITAEAAGLQTGLNDAKGSLQEFAISVRSSLESLKPVAASIGFAITALVVSGFRELVETGRAMTELRVAVQGAGSDFALFRPEAERLIEAMRALGFDTPDVTNAMAELARHMPTEDIERFLPMAADLSRAMGVSLPEAALILGLAFEGNTGRLERFIGPLQTGENWVTKLQKAVGGLAEQLAKTDPGVALAGLKNAFVDIGGALLGLKDATGVAAAINDLAGHVRAFAQAVADASPALKTAVIAVGAFLTVWGGASGLGALAGAIGLTGLAGALGSLAGVAAPLIAVLGLLAIAWQTDFGGIREVMDEFWASVKPVLLDFAALAKEQWKEWGPVLKDLLSLFDLVFYGILATVTEAITLVLKLLRDVVKLFKALFEGDWAGVWKAFGQIVKDVLNGIDNFLRVWFGDIYRKVYDWAAGLVQRIIDGLLSMIEALKNAVQNLLSHLTFGLIPAPNTSPAAPGAGGGQAAGNNITVNVDATNSVYANDQAIKGLATQIGDELGARLAIP